MTDDEQQMLRELHAALLEVPPGSPKDVRPLLEDVRIVVRAYQRASWATRALVWFLPTIAGLGAAIATIRGWGSNG